MRVRSFVKAAALSAVMITMAVMPVKAASSNFSFRVEYDVDDADATQYSANTLKTDDDDYARATYTSSNITSNDDFTFCVVGQYGDSSEYSEEVNATAVTGTYHLTYEKQAYNGNNYRLRGRTYAYYVVVSGDWAP